MKFPFAVYTAHHGYAWSNIPDGFSEASLKRFEQIVTASKPEYMNEGERFEGIIYAQAHLVVFSAMRVPNWDYSNRTSLYYAFAFLPRQECKKINIDQLLKSACFTTPSKEPKDAIDYVGGPSVSAPENVISDFKNGTPTIQSLDFAYCGDLLCEIGNIAEKWWIFRTVGTSSDWAKVVFERNPFFTAPKSMPDFSKVIGTVGPASSNSGGSESRVISLDHSNDSDPMIRLEMKFASALKAIKKEREADAVAMAALTARVNKLTIAVCVIVAIAVLALGVILFNNGGIAKLSDILLGPDSARQEEKAAGSQPEQSKPIHPASTKAAVGTTDTNNAAKVNRGNGKAIPDVGKSKSGIDSKK